MDTITPELKTSLILKSDVFKLKIKESLENKIRQCCKESWNTEWSGVLFYTIEGNFKDNNIEVICEDLLIMDVGSKTFTEFEENADIVSYMVDNHLLETKRGLIHSHNTFSTFFSSTDQETLLSEGLKRDNFVSLIVNNEGNYSASITRKCTSIITAKYTSTYDFENTSIDYESKYKDSTNTFIEYFKLDITIEGAQVITNIIDRFKALKEKKIIPIATSKPSYPLNGIIANSNTSINSNTSVNTNIKSVYSPYVSTKYLEQDSSDFDTVAYNNNYLPKTFTDKNEETESLKNILDIKYPINTVNLLIKQLVTGSILYNNNSSSLLSLVQAMPAAYKKRFGGDDEGFQLYQNWVQTYVEFLLYNTDVLDIYDPDENCAIIANNILKELEKIPEKDSNDYLEEIIETLRNYILDYE
jgi:proteasome lid subunit RPN8/RPN11